MKVQLLLKKSIYIFVIFVIFSSCQDDDQICGSSIEHLSDCLKSEVRKIEELNNDGLAYIREYEFQNETVYYIKPGFNGHDQFEEVLNENCELIGKVGGVFGNTIIRGDEFWENAILKDVVWRR